MRQTRGIQARGGVRADGAKDRPSAAPACALAAAFCAAILGCGDDFVRNEALGDAGAAVDSTGDANALDDAAANDVAETRALDVPAVDAAGQDASDAQPAACTTSADCDETAKGPCQTATCLSGICVVSPRTDGTPCDDGVGCALLDRCEEGQCQAGATPCPCQFASDCAAFDDKNPCNGLPFCDLSGPTPQCAVHPGTIVTCGESGAPCQIHACHPETGACAAGPEVDGKLCDDGQPCTAGEACASGSCQGGKPQCACQSDADCLAKDDKDVCNGNLYCDTSAFPYQCQTNPATVVQCVADANSDDCAEVSCQPETGACASVALAAGVTCSDGDTCSVGDACQQGVCKPGTNTCPCKVDADCKGLDDGNACNGSLYCDTTSGKGGCKINPASVVLCPASAFGTCQTLSCDPADGACKKVPTAQGTPCQDGVVCTVGDACAGGACLPGPNACACQADVDCGAFEDGDVCNGSLFCDKGSLPFVCKVNAKTIVTCPEDLQPCTTMACQPQTGACKSVSLPAGAPCDADGFACTTADACLDGSCVAGTNICVCQAGADCAEHEDDSVCNGTLFCNKSALPFVCQVNPATLVTCPLPPPGSCLVAACNAKTGACSLLPAGDGAACNADGDACTSGDACAGGVCKPGTPVCACTSDADCQAKDDGDPCNGVLQCDKGAAPFACKPKAGSVVVCDPSNDTPCVRNTCSGGTCKLLPGPYPCEDGNSCTVGDVCTQGSCAPGTKQCGCKVDGDCQALDDNNLCNGIWHCALEQCAPKPGSAVTCQLGSDPCSPDKCKPATGKCEPTPTTSTDGVVCEDGNDKTIGDSCNGGKCLPGLLVTPNVCDDGNTCTQDDELAGGLCVYNGEKDGGACGKSGAKCSGGSCGACTTWSKRYPDADATSSTDFKAVVPFGPGWLAFGAVSQPLSAVPLIRGVHLSTNGGVAIGGATSGIGAFVRGAAPADEGAVIVGTKPLDNSGVAMGMGDKGFSWTYTDSKSAGPLAAVARGVGQKRWLAVGQATGAEAVPWVVELDDKGDVTASGGFGSLAEPGGSLVGAQLSAVESLGGKDWLIGGSRMTANGPGGLLMRLKEVSGKGIKQSVEWTLSGTATEGRVFHGVAYGASAKIAVAVGGHIVEVPMQGVQAVVVAVLANNGTVAWQWSDASGGIGQHNAVAPLGTGFIAAGLLSPAMGGKKLGLVGVLRAFDSEGKLRWARAVADGASSGFDAVSGSTAVSGTGAGGIAVGRAQDGLKGGAAWAVRFGYDGEIFCGDKP